MLASTKQALVSAATLIVCLACIAAGTALSFSTSKAAQVENRFGTGTDAIELVSELSLPDDLGPGSFITTSLRARNTGQMDCFVRMRVVLSSSAAEDFASIQFNAEWEEGPDGQRYYMAPLEPSGLSSPLCSGILISENAAPQAFEDFDVLAVCESVQATDPRTGEPFANAREAFAYFEGGAS